MEEILKEILGADILPTDEFYKKTANDLADWIKSNQNASNDRADQKEEGKKNSD